MAEDVTPESSPAPQVEDLFYSESPKATDIEKPEPEADATPAEKEPAAAPEREAEKQTEDKADAADGDEPAARAQPERGADGKFKRSDANSRIRQLLAEKKQLEQQLRQREQPAEPAKAPEPHTAAVADLKPPTPGDFETWEQYQTAHNAYIEKLTESKIKAAIDQDRQEQKRVADEKAQHDQLEAAHKAWTTQVTESTKRHPDFAQKVLDEAGNVAVPLHPVFDALIPKSKVGAEILYQLAGDLEEASRIAEMDQFEAGAEFYRLQAEASAALQVQAKKKPVPPSTVSGRGGTPKERSMEDVFYG